MCGVFGFSKKGSYSKEEFNKDSHFLFKQTELRGRQASGLAVATSEKINFYKAPDKASKIIKRKSYKDFVKQSFLNSNDGISFIGHCRLTTDGSEIIQDNNQPIHKGPVIGVHNGVINNYRNLIKDEDLNLRGSSDTEVFIGLIEKELNAGTGIESALKTTYKKIEGAAAAGLLFENYNYLVISSNFGSLYYCQPNKDIFVFASEKQIVQKFLDKKNLNGEAKQLKPGTAGALNRSNHEFSTIDLTSEDHSLKKVNSSSRKSIHFLYPNPSNMKYCKRCILPESYPLLTFDDEGVCSQCNKYQSQKLKGKDALEKIFSKHRSKDGSPDCLLGLSGGRDSCYNLHLLVKEFNMTPVCFVYDWLMTSTLARHNISKMAAALGVEVIYRTGDYEVQAANIRNNIYGFLKSPHLGMLPFVQAGDKDMYHYGRKLRKELNLNLTVWGSGFQLEQREFFIGYSGINKTLKNNPRLYNYGWMTKALMVAFYGFQTLKNPYLWNRSIFDNALAFWHSFIAKDDFLYFFEYYPWDEQVIERTLKENYGWEVDTDYGPNQWRMDDFHTAFNNYVYYTVGGFSEFDDFRSNQIREGLLTRQEALKLAAQDNQIRYESLLQFSQIVGFNLEHVLKKIEAIPKLY